MTSISARSSSGPSRPDRPSRGPNRGPKTERPSRDGQKGPSGPRTGGGGRPPRDGQGQPRHRTGGGRPGGTQGGSRGSRYSSAPFTIKGELLFGRNAILESLRAGRRKATRLWVAEGLRQDDRVDEIVELARINEVLVETVPRTMLDDQEPDVNHQGVLLETTEYSYADLADVVEAEGTVLILDHLQDPQNFGTLIRAADAAGAAGVVIPSDRSASVSPAVVNSSAGAVEHINVALVANLGNAIEKLEASGRWILGLDGGPGSAHRC